MNHDVTRVEETVKMLTGNCNIGILHPFDKERIVKIIWGLAQRDLLHLCEIPAMARDQFNWSPGAVNFLKSTIDVIDVFHPMVKRREIKLREFPMEDFEVLYKDVIGLMSENQKAELRQLWIEISECPGQCQEALKGHHDNACGDCKPKLDRIEELVNSVTRLN